MDGEQASAWGKVPATISGSGSLVGKGNGYMRYERHLGFVAVRSPLQANPPLNSSVKAQVLCEQAA